ncbi:MAG: hypothetical protein DMF89_08590 [Acidobacteria bacterium]|nr:MAG: hypothetical protein DMF89_08590 [Acidobacteriota bacterium]
MQRFQIVSGTLGRHRIESGRLRGEEIAFTVGATTYRGRVDRDRMRVSAKLAGKLVEWTARPGLRP